MDPPTFEAFEAFGFTEAELNNAGLLGDGISGFATRVLETMKEHPELLKLSLFTLECMNFSGRRRQRPAPPGSPTLSNVSAASSNLSALTLASDATVISQYTPSEWERNCYYNRITGDGDHPKLVYRSNFLTAPFLKPVGIHTNTPVKSLRGVFDTPLNGVWDTVGPEIRDLIKARKINWSSIDPARFFTHESRGPGSLGPVVIWVGVIPGSTSSDTAHEVSQEILTLLRKNGVEDAVVEWREAVLQRLAGPPLMRHASWYDATRYVRRFLTALLGIPLGTEGMEGEEDAQGTLTLWFHENKDKDGNPSDKVYGVSNCHVLRTGTTAGYERRVRGPKDYVQVCGMHRFQRGLDEIREEIRDHCIRAEILTREIAGWQATERQDAETVELIRARRRDLEGRFKAIADLEAFYNKVTSYWSDINFHRNIGHVQYAAPITVDVEGGTLYTLDWAAFLAAEAKVKDGFEGNVVDLGSKYSMEELAAMFHSLHSDATTFQFPVWGTLRIEGCATKEDLANPAQFDNKGQRCLMVGKDGNTTDLTIGCYAGLVSFTLNEVGVDSVELGIYNSGVQRDEPFSAKGDSGALVWHTTSDKGRIVGQLHSGSNIGGSTSNHVTYCTPGWFLLEQIRKKFKHADFYRTTWSD